MCKRILVVSDCHTHPVRGGNQQCIMQYVNILREIGFDVYFLYVDLYEARFITDETRKYWGDHFFYYATPSWQIVCQKIRRRIEHCYYSPKLDVYYPCGLTQYVNKIHEKYGFHGLIVNYIWLSKLAECDIPIKTIFTHDVFTDRNDKLGKKDAWYSFSKDEEAKGIARFKEVLSIQDEEASWFRKLSPHSNVRTVYSPFEFVSQPITCNKNILFFSGGGQLNKDGLEWFLHEVWPIVEKRDSEIRLLVGGNICNNLDKSNLSGNVVLKGLYDNPDDFYTLGDICINPVFNGSGLKIKTFEALAHGKLTIVHPHSALGVYQPKAIPLFRSDNPTEYADVIFSFITSYDKLTERKEKCKEYISGLNQYILDQYSDVFK